MKAQTWKTLAIIFGILFLLETSFWIYSYNVVTKDEENMNICYYEVCGEYPQAFYEDNICHCYDYDILGELVVSKSKVIK